MAIGLSVRLELWLAVIALLSSIRWIYSQVSQYRRLGKSRLRTLFTRELPTRWALDKYGQEGYEKYHKKGQPFVLKVFGQDYWVLPPKHLQDIKSALADSLSFFQALSDAFNMQASVGNLYHSTLEITVVAKHLNSQFAKVVPLLADEAMFAIEKELGGLSDWKSFNASTLCAKLLHRTTSRILVGQNLCRNEEYLEVSGRFSKSLFIFGTLWNFMALGPLRKLFARLTIGGHTRDLNHATRMLLPVIHERLAERSNGVDISNKYTDMLQWIIDTPASIPEDNDPLHQAHHLMHLTFAASSASGVLVTHGLFQLLMFPKYVLPLREEVERAVQEQQGWTEKALSSMPLLDSFLRETMRMYPAGSLTVARTVMDKSFKLHDGFELAKGSRVIFPALAIQMDPANYVNPETFDGFRFAPSHSEKYGQKPVGAATVNNKFLQFGYGPHACPGRFYAVRKAKIVLGMLLTRYEFNWEGDVSARPPGIAIEAQLVPNDQARVRFKSR
ncbi:putative cytochrome P450 monooxygenase [Xylariaceae sp. FL1651]|nr:putative cytochrome P450 monooxygenase [Xylariaceae sp. FL1651]